MNNKMNQYNIYSSQQTPNQYRSPLQQPPAQYNQYPRHNPTNPQFTQSTYSGQQPYPMQPRPYTNYQNNQDMFKKKANTITPQKNPTMYKAGSKYVHSNLTRKATLKSKFNQPTLQ
jgi:hypothetical protein